MSELSQQLKASIEELARIRKISGHIQELTTRLADEERALKVMEATLTKEQQDVEALEREGLTSMFRKFLGDREEKLEKEREEYLKASLRFNELFKSVQLIRYELEVLNTKATQEDSVLARIGVLIKEREAELLKTDPAMAQVIKGLYEQADKWNAYKIQVEEAIAAGVEALEFVRGVEHDLIQAKLMGNREMWGGGRYWSGQQKHAYIDMARDKAYRSRHALIRFGHELRDVFPEITVQFNLEIEAFGRFVDIFFDNLISDFLIQQKITKSLVDVTATRQQMEALLQQLEEEKAMVDEKRYTLEEERKQAIIRSSS